ncbi:hypothetical protein OHS33_21720 [Streptomyces sp. NBC_00536]|uniref:hypothetical protein n=1 Tax=Streptomyces sp. NBC_00536 TaxID=2975769 RepID=UPI002E8070CA|nr:hypothetical protein [Streptomyces sp. NBC_00536]WUC80712.1 hypothetical protein OHS33_21720 [Streptomyces sp. NBC_00536]
MARSSSGIVAGLIAAALAAVGFLGYQASASAPARPVAAPKQPAPASAAPSQSAAPEAPGKPGPVPADSGKGVRVVYSVSQKRVWLVGEDGVGTKTFTVMPSTVHPKAGSYSVDTRQGSVTGSDGAAVEHIVRFATTDGVVIGFSARKDGATPEPDATKKTGGIRMNKADGDTMWNFATIGTRVVVVA